MYKKYRNKYAVIHVSFNDISRQCTTYEQYTSRIERRLIRDLKKEYPDVELAQEESVVDVLMDIYMAGLPLCAARIYDRNTSDCKVFKRI